MPGLLQKLVLIHTNDIHSHFEQMPGVAGLVRMLRDKHKGNPAIVIDCGDHMDRVRAETEGTDGLANVAVMNETGYDLALIGNNEGLTFTRDVLRETIGGHARFAMLGGNLREAASGKPPEWLEPCRILEAGPLKVGFIGVTAFFTDFYRLLGWEIADPFTVVLEWTAKLRDQVDVLVVLSHLGYANDQRMAREIPGIDVILGGHTHHLLEEPQFVGRTAIGATGKYGQFVGEMVVEFDPDARKVVRITGMCHPVGEAAEDAGIRRLIGRYRSESSRRLESVVAELAEPLEIDWSRESRLGNLLAEGLRRRVGAEIGIVNSGQLLQSLRAGTVTKEMLLNMCPSPINPCRLILKGADIVQALEESLLDEYIYKPVYGFGFRGKMLGTLCVDGLHIEYDPAAEPYRKIMRILVGDAPLRPEAGYCVGTIDMFTFGVGYLSLKKGEQLRYFLPEFLRDLLATQLIDGKALKASRIRRFVPVSR